MSLTDLVKTSVGKIVFPPLHAVTSYHQTTRQRAYEACFRAGETFALGEPVFSDILRGAYRTLEYFGIPDPVREKILRRYGSR